MEPVTLTDTDSFKHKRRVLLIGLVIALIATTAVYVGIHSYSSITVNVMSISVYFISNDTSNHSVSFAKIIPYNHETIYGGDKFTFSFYFKNSNNKNITFLTIKTGTNGFKVSGITPALPYVLVGNNIVTFQITVQVPNFNFAGNVNVYLYVRSL